MHRLQAFIAERKGMLFTFMVVPGAGGQVRSWRLSVLKTYGAALLLVVAAIGVLGTYLWAGQAVASLNLYRFRTATLEEAKAGLESQLDEQSIKLEQLVEATEMLAQRLAGLESLGDEIRQSIPDGLAAAREISETIGGGKAGALLQAPLDQNLQGNRQMGIGLGRATDGIGGGESSPAVLALWVEERLTSLSGSLSRQGKELRGLGESIDAYNHRLDHIPSTWPARGRVTSEFGRRRHPVTRKSQDHNGIDIAVWTGTPVKAAAAGRVVEAGWNGGYGRTVVVEHGYGLKTLYAHNSKLAARVGQDVRRGDVLAFSGSSGMSTGPHVHYEVMLHGRPVNPRGYLDRGE